MPSEQTSTRLSVARVKRERRKKRRELKRMTSWIHGGSQGSPRQKGDVDKGQQQLSVC